MIARPDKQALAQQLNLALREATALGQVFGETVAGRVGLGGIDLEYLDIIALRGRMTAGELAGATGLTTGAVTGVIDRLESAGFVRRERDARDRRRVHVVVVPARLAAAARHYESMGAAVAKLTAEYSAEDISLILDYVTRSTAVVREELEKLKARRPR
jgi:DNA-binding MarR family transcriptional regulator